MLKRLPLVFLLLAMTTAHAAAPDTDQQHARDLLAKLVSYKTEAGQGQVPAMAAYLAQQFRDAGFADADIHLLPLDDTASLVVRYRGDGSGGRPIVLLGHMDVVTAKPEDWQRDPFTMGEEDGFFFGRGTLDMKNGVASLTSTFLRLKKEGFVPTRDLVIAFSGDEETAQLTARDQVEKHRDLVDAEFALNSDSGGGGLDEQGRATMYALQTAEKTYASFELSTHNPGGHSSVPRADNAIYELADALERLQAYRFPVMWNDTTLAAFAQLGADAPGAEGEAMRAFARDPKDATAADALSRVPLESARLRTTCVPTLLRGGHADNALPQSAVATVNCRIFPGVAIEDVRQALQALAGDKVAVGVIGMPAWSDASPMRKDVFDAVSRAVHARHPGIPVIPMQESGASDGIFYRAAGIPTYGVSETFIKDSDAFAHGLNERLPVQSFHDGLDYWYDLLKILAGPETAQK
jgi:acetylornithine deacetylase/succinyl-diaminopimelate desuccinylase-like protein